jgi:hypothetical protein
MGFGRKTSKLGLSQLYISKNSAVLTYSALAMTKICWIEAAYSM